MAGVLYIWRQFHLKMALVAELTISRLDGPVCGGSSHGDQCNQATSHDHRQVGQNQTLSHFLLSCKGFMHSGRAWLVWFGRIGCDFPMWMQYSLVAYMASFLVLFSDFYYKVAVQCTLYTVQWTSLQYNMYIV